MGLKFGPEFAKRLRRQRPRASSHVEGVARQGDIDNDIIAKALKKARLEFDQAKALTERGDNISPGQAQRLSLARVFAKDEARLVILDEATSMLDVSTQTKIMEEMRRHVRGRALVMVAHRLDTLRWTDRILVIDQGRIVQSGTYDELSAQPGVFAVLRGEQAPHQLAAAE